MNKIISFIKKHKILSINLISILTIVLVCFFTIIILFTAKTDNKNDVNLYIYPNTTYENLYSNLQKQNIISGNSLSFTLFSKLFSLDSNFKTGYYVIKKNTSVYSLVKKIRNGEQQTIRIAINNTRTADIFAEKVSKKLLLSKEDIIKAIDSLHYDYPNELFYYILPDTYEFYWTVSAKDFIQRLFAFSDRWWKKQNFTETAGLTKQEIITLASIVQEETQQQDEKATIAGVYINRLKSDMLLQADPTVKFAYGDFTIKRIRFEHLKTDSPFNTYKYKGLPPAPICLPDISTIESVLHYKRHNYLYFCAKEDFSGYHNFASTIQEHNLNAKKYHSSLNKHNIK